jgi:predicted signal transduction protein with EAL and GGDEF domain
MAPANTIARASAPDDGTLDPNAPLIAEIERLRAEIAVAERKIRELEARADTDLLLDIRNRRGFMRELKRSLAHLQRYKGEAALLFIDFDGFKGVNDTHGHAAGDAILKRWRRSSPTTCAPPTLWRGSAATNSACCCGIWRRRWR